MKPMKILLLGLFGVATIAASAQTAQPAKIEWNTWAQAAAKMEKQPRKLMVDVFTEWCGWCKKMDAGTMVDQAIIQLVNTHFYAVKLDGEYTQDIVFKGRTYKFVPVPGRRGYHELPAELMGGKMSYPTLVFLDENYGIIQALPGYYEAAKLEPILAFFGTDSYKNTAWEAYSAGYKSLITR